MSPTQWAQYADDPMHCCTSSICQLEGLGKRLVLIMNAEKVEVEKRATEHKVLATICNATDKTERVVLSSVLHAMVPLGRACLVDLTVYTPATVHPHS